MIRSTLLLVLLPLAAVVTPSQPAPEPEPFHCQVPCGIYGDRMRIDMLMEDAATIEKAMKQIKELEKAGASNSNQLVRWIMTKDEHAASIQETIASYWLAQRIKTTDPGTDKAAMSKYYGNLAALHGITVRAMKCKQTTETVHVDMLRMLALEFSKSYFSAEDLKHIEAHHAGHKH